MTRHDILLNDSTDFEDGHEYSDDRPHVYDFNAFMLQSYESIFKLQAELKPQFPWFFSNVRLFNIETLGHILFYMKSPVYGLYATKDYTLFINEYQEDIEAIFVKLQNFTLNCHPSVLKRWKYVDNISFLTEFLMYCKIHQATL